MDQIYGHDNIKSSLRHAASIGRLHHALMFAGPVGVGKMSVALAFTQLLFCDNADPAHNTSACGHCDSCARFKSEWLKLDNDFFPEIDDPISGLYVKEGLPNILLIDEPGNIIKVGAIRALRKKLAESPFTPNKPRFVLIRDAHKMMDSAANALLKTLEEPSDDTSFILTTSKIQSILPTIISRSQVVRFAPFETDQVVSWLKLHHPQSPDYELTQYATLAAGSLGEAEKFMTLPEKKKAKEEEDAEINTGSADGQLIIQTFQNIINLRSSCEALALAASMKGKKSILEPLARILMMFLRDVLLRQASPNAPVLIKHHLDIIDRCAHTAKPKDVVKALETVQNIYNALMNYANEQIAWERLMLCFCGIVYMK